MNDKMRMLAWFLMAIPVAAVTWGIVTFVFRFMRLGQQAGPESDQLVLGAVSQSLRERGELADSLGQLRTVHERILDALPMGVLWLDRHRCVAALNSAGRRLLAVKPGVVGLKASFVLEPFPWLLEGLTRVPGPSWVCDGGGRRWRIQRMEAPDKIGALLQFEDITEEELAERRRLLRERFAELGEMTAGVAHQLKNSLAVFKGHAQLLKKNGPVDVGEELLVETEDLERLVQRFLQWAKPLDPQLADLDLHEIAGRAVDEVGRRSCAQGRTLGLEGQGRALADTMLLYQALVNLLENACEATPAGGRVLVKVFDQGLQILDEGSGLGEETLTRLLKPFESGRPSGTGLGLPLALKWLNVQGADLDFQVRPEGGTCTRVQW